MPILLLFTGALLFLLTGCGEDPPLPGEEILSEMETGYGKQAVLNSIPEGPGAETSGTIEHGYRLDRYFLDGRLVEILWMRVLSPEPLEALTRGEANPVIFVDQVLDGWGWAHFDERRVRWGMEDHTDPTPPPEPPVLQHDDTPGPDRTP